MAQFNSPRNRAIMAARRVAVGRGRASQVQAVPPTPINPQVQQDAVPIGNPFALATTAYGQQRQAAAGVPGVPGADPRIARMQQSAAQLQSGVPMPANPMAGDAAILSALANVGFSAWGGLKQRKLDTLEDALMQREQAKREGRPWELTPPATKRQQYAAALLRGKSDGELDSMAMNFGSTRDSVVARNTPPPQAPIEYRDLGDRLGAFQGDKLLSEFAKGAAPQAQEGFSLSGGQTRYDARGNVIASAPKAEEGFSLGPGQARFDASGRQVASVAAPPPPQQQPPGFSLSPGQTRYDAQGNPIASAPAVPNPKTDGAAAQNQRTFDAYSSSMQSLSDALGRMNTGPFVGYTTGNAPEAQVAQSARVAAGQALKNIFREAGEGAFTNADQEQLLSMLPDRYTDENAIPQIFANIDSQIRQKLGMPPGEGPPFGYQSLADRRGTTSGSAIKGTSGAGGGKLMQISDDAGYDALPSGAQFVGPDGVLRRKP